MAAMVKRPVDDFGRLDVALNTAKHGVIGPTRSAGLEYQGLSN
jgi:hypothetical protein